jgi:hypothetical protein
VGIIADERRLRQILTNLLDNAVKFTEKGSVTLKVAKVTKVTKVEDDNRQSSIVNLQFSIEDTGIGIAKEKLQELCSPFSQGYEEYYYSNGAGLGLAMSCGLLRLMGSELHVESTAGQGSRFWFELHVPEISGAAGPTEWTYEELSAQKGELEGQAAREALQLIPLPAAETKQLLAFAERGSVKRILAVLNDIDEHRDEKYRPFIKKLRELAESFQIDEIVELLTPEDET